MSSTLMLVNLLGFVTAMATNPDGDLAIQLLSGANLVVESNANGPELVYLGAKITNNGDNTLTDLSINIGDFDAQTAGVYPARTHAGLNGSLSLKHLGTNSTLSDAFRYIGDLAPGESSVQYWLVEYPQTDQNGTLVSLAEGIEDDLWLEYDVWASAQDAGAALMANTSQKLNFRLEERKADILVNEPNAQNIPPQYADLLQSILGTVDQNSSPAIAGQKLVVPVWNQLGQVKEGFDANEDLLPDFNAFLQPVGRLATFDPSCFRLIHTSGVLLLEDPNANISFVPFNDQIHFLNINRENVSVMALVNYEFMVLGNECESNLSPYQSVANFFEKERFNQNYGHPVGQLKAAQHPFSLQANTLDSVPLGHALPIQYQFGHTSPHDLGVPRIAAGISVHAKIPTGTHYLAGSVTGLQNILFSTDQGATWQTEEPADASLVSDILWLQKSSIPQAEIVELAYQLSIPPDFSGSFVASEAKLQVQGGEALLTTQKIIPIAGNQMLAGQVFADTASIQAYANGQKEANESGLANLKLALYLDSNENGILDATEPLLRTQTTDADGNYQFDALPVATFILAVDTDSSLLKNAWMAPNGSTHKAVSLSAGNLSDFKIALSPLLHLATDLRGPASVIEGGLLRYQLSLQHMFEQTSLSLTAAKWSGFYNPAQLEFVSANPVPTELDIANGRLSWMNMGALHSGQEQTIELVFRPLATSYTQDYLVQLVSKVEAIKLSDQRQFNALTDTLQQLVKPSGSISGYVWNDFSGSVAGWYGSNGFEGTDGFFPQLKLMAYVCEGSSGERLTPANASKLDAGCSTSINAGTWVLLDSVYTQNDGSYHFCALGEGYFYVAVAEASLPAGSTAQGDPDETGVCQNCDARWGNPLDKLADLPLLDASTDYQNINFGFAHAPSLSGQVWQDINGDGIRGPLETGISNFPIELLSNSCIAGVDCPVVNTDTEGRYRFANLADGQAYSISLGTHPLSNQYTFVQTAEADATIDGSIQETINHNQGHHSLDFGFQIQGEASLLVKVQADWNGNLQQDVADEGINGVWVSLYFDADEDGAFDAQLDPLVAASQTNGQGQALFSQLKEGTYFHQVQIQDHSVLGQTQLIGDPDENGANCSTCDAIAKNTIAAGPTNTTAEWYFRPLGDYRIDGLVWQDQNGDKKAQRAIEAPLENISISLAVDLNQDGTFVVLETQSSDLEGAFRFAELINATYQVSVDTQDTDLPQNASGSLFQATNPTQSLATINEGVFSFNSQEGDLLYFGFGPLASVGDIIFWDFDGDGQRDPLEKGIAGVEVCLCIGEVNPCSSANAFMTTTTSDGTDGNAIGSYKFEDLSPGDYTIGVKTHTAPIANATLKASPAAFGSTCQGSCESQYHFEIPNGREINGIDFGYEAKGVMGGVVWLDINNNKVMDAGEQGLANQTIALIPPSRVDIGGGRGRAVIKTTNENGEYNFNGLPDGFYRLSAKAPVGYVLTNDGDGDINGLAYIYIRSGKVIAIGRTYCNDCDMEANVGLRVGGYYSINGKVCIDDPSIDGSCDNASLDQGLEGLSVILTNSDGTYLGMGETDADGNYSFTNLNAGTYNVSLLQDRFPLDVATLSTDVSQSVASQILSNSEQTTLQLVLGSASLSGVDFAFDLSVAFDLGNLPMSYYERTGFAYHIIDDNNHHFLGQQVVSEAVNLSTTIGYVADGNAVTNNLDDGVSFLELSSWQDGTLAQGKGGGIQIDASATGWLVGWIDFNQDQDFLDQGEMIVNQVANAGSNVYTFDIPVGTSLDQTYFSRFRFFESEPEMALVAFSGGAVGGEIEDYSIDFSSLPVELIAFEAKQGEQSVELAWTTASEENTHSFAVERSIDGLLFNNIAQVAAAGNTTDLQFYDWQDQSIANLDFPKIYYRLKMIDLDGSYTYSQIESVLLTQASDFSLMLAPSPPKDMLKVEFTADPKQAAELTVVNSLGQIMWSENLMPEPGVNYWQHPVGEYLHGVYFIRLSSGHEKRVVKFIIN